MNILLSNRRYANASDIELIDIALDEGYHSLAYALACRLEVNLTPDESKSINRLESDKRSLQDEGDNLELQVSQLECQLSELADNEEKLKTIVARAKSAVSDTLRLINP